MHDRGRTTLLAWGWDEVTGYDTVTGEIVWGFPAKGGGDYVASIVADRERLYLANPDGVVAIARDANSPTAGRQLWRAKTNANCSTPVSNGERLFTVSDLGVVTAVDATTGAVAWRKRLGGEFRASPVIAGDRLYVGDLAGRLHVASTNDSTPRFETHEIGSPIFASIAPVNSSLLLRTENALYRIGRTTADAALRGSGQRKHR
jgi:outer membrane protein assembly factor BamB